MRKVIIDEILEALQAFESNGHAAQSVFLGPQRVQQLRRVSAAYRSVVATEEEDTDTFLGLPVKVGDFPPDYIGFNAKSKS